MDVINVEDVVDVDDVVDAEDVVDAKNKSKTCFQEDQDALSTKWFTFTCPQRDCSHRGY